MLVKGGQGKRQNIRYPISFHSYNYPICTALEIYSATCSNFFRELHLVTNQRLGFGDMHFVYTHMGTCHLSANEYYNECLTCMWCGRREESRMKQYGHFCTFENMHKHASLGFQPHLYGTAP